MKDIQCFKIVYFKKKNRPALLVSFVCRWDQRHSITQMEHIIVLKEGLVIFLTFLWAKEKSWNNRFL